MGAPLASAPLARLAGSAPRTRAACAVRAALPRSGRRTADLQCVAALRARAARRGGRPACASSAATDGGPGASSSLDAAAATVALLRTELPFPATRDLVGENVKYSFLSPLVTLDGKSQYFDAMAYWRAELPRRLGDGWRVRPPMHACYMLPRGRVGRGRSRAHCARYLRRNRRTPSFRTHPLHTTQWETSRVFQPDARTLVVRWRMQWTARPLGFSQWPLEEAPPPPAAGGVAKVCARVHVRVLRPGLGVT
jgi:hypothetical protein